jgi:hypothetical protein
MTQDQSGSWLVLRSFFAAWTAASPKPRQHQIETIAKT